MDWICSSISAISTSSSRIRRMVCCNSKGLGRHPRTDRVSGSISDFQSHVPFVVPFRSGFKKCFQPRQMG